MISPRPDHPPVSHVERLHRLIQPGIVGNFTHCELTEIFANVEGVSGPQNVFSIAVMEERDVAASPRLMNPKRLLLQGLRGWSFGLCRTVITVPEFERSLASFDATGAWSPAGSVLTTGALCQADPQFVPADWTDSTPLNKVLKNNFWSGSHILEWADSEKRLFEPFFERASLLKELTEILSSFVPVDLAAVSDRLGNILVQVPVRVLIASCEATRDHSDFRIQVAWRPGAARRPVRATMMAEYDGSVTGFTTAVVENEPVKLSLPGDTGAPRMFLLDEGHDVLVGATGSLYWFNQVGLTAHPVGRQEPRTFSYVDRAGQMQSRRIALRGPKQDMLVGEPRKDPNGGFTQKRLYRYDTERVLNERLFEQYGLPGRDVDAEHARAIADLHHLIAVHGEEGAWLWDPYLDAIDIMETLFHSPHGGAELRAMSNGANRCNGLSMQDHIVFEGQVLSAIMGNFLGLCLEYRIPYQVQSSEFHDRFLILPKRQGGHLAWSLGTSINSLGRAHHILQRVDDGQRVSDAFQDLWGRTGPAQLVWRKS
jgi:hypothetical protein